MVAVLAVFGVAAPSVKVLIIDQTQGFMESMQVGVLARILRTSTDFEVQIAGTTQLPEGPLPQGPFQLVIIVPAAEEWVWVCTPGLPGTLAPEIQGFLQLVKGAVGKVFRGERTARDPADDLYALSWSAYFLRIGVLGGVSGR
jgi:hypothetical protein